MEEIYKTIVGFEKYEVSNYGNIRNIKSGRILKEQRDKLGYHIVGLFIDKKQIPKLVHRLVAETFLDNLDTKRCVDHIDNNPSNNNISNLRYATHKENRQNSKISACNTTGTKGVTFDKKMNKFRVQFYIDGKLKHLGYFNDIEDAIQCRIIKANQVFGIFTNSCEKINEI